MAKRVTKGQEKKAVQQQNVKFDRIIQVKEALEKAYNNKYNDNVSISEKEVTYIKTLLKAQPQLAITEAEDSKLNKVLLTFATIAINHDFPNVIRLILDKNLIPYIDHPILNMAISMGRNAIVKLLVQHPDMKTKLTSTRQS